MVATRRTEVGKEHIRPIQVGGESFDMNPPRGGLTAVVIVMVTAQMEWGGNYGNYVNLPSAVIVYDDTT